MSPREYRRLTDPQLTHISGSHFLLRQEITASGGAPTRSGVSTTCRRTAQSALLPNSARFYTLNTNASLASAKKVRGGDQVLAAKGAYCCLNARQFTQKISLETLLQFPNIILSYCLKTRPNINRDRKLERRRGKYMIRKEVLPAKRPSIRCQRVFEALLSTARYRTLSVFTA